MAKRTIKNTPQRVIKSTQWKFTFVIVVIMTGLLIAAFVSIYVFTMVGNQFSIDTNLESAIERFSTETDQPAEEDEEFLIKNEVILYYVEGHFEGYEEGVGVPDEEDIKYTIKETKNENALRTDERNPMQDAIIASAEKNESPQRHIESPDNRTYYIKVRNQDKEYKFIVPIAPDPDNPPVPGGNGGDDGELPEVDTITLVLYNRWVAVYDYTAESSALTTLILVLGSVFLVAAVLIFFLGYILSGKLLEPASDAFTRQRDLVANASHELKTPITIINADIEVLMSDPDAKISSNTKWIDNIVEQTDRMNKLVIEMLQLSSFERVDYIGDVQLVNIGEKIEGELLSFEAPCFERNITLKAGIAPNITAEVDINGLSKLTTILLDNAVKYCSENGKIFIKLQAVRRAVVFEVSNTGEKIPDDKISKIFERFYKHGDNSVSFGLGLSMAKAIVENMRGKITAHSDGKLTTFRAIIPIK